MYGVEETRQLMNKALETILQKRKTAIPQPLFPCLGGMNPALSSMPDISLTTAVLRSAAEQRKLEFGG